MGKRDSYDAGTFSWAELASTDAEAAKTFYGKLFGWSYDDQDMGDDGVYTLATIDGAVVGGLFQSDGPARWNSYISVDDVEAATEKAEEAGATIHASPFEVGPAGRMSVIQDPTGGVVSLWEAKDRAGADVVNVHGALTWNDLMTYDVGEAAEFYCEVFGWEVAEVDAGGADDDDEDDADEDGDGDGDGESGDSGKIHVDANDATTAPGDGEGEDSDADDDDDDDSDDDDDDDEESDEPGSQTTRGEDQRLVIRNGERLNGGMATIPRSAGEAVPPHWLPSFTVESIEAALTDVRDGGGEVMAGPIDVPAGKFALVADPTGAVLGVIAGDMDD